MYDLTVVIRNTPHFEATGARSRLLELNGKGRASLPARPELWCPDTQGTVLGSELEVVVGTQQGEIVPNAQLSEQRVDGADLNARSAACVPKIGRCDMVFAIGLKQGKRGEAFNDLCARLGSGESLKQFLENQPGRDNDIGAHEGVLEQVDFRLRGRGIAAQGERPNAGVDQQRHDLERSAL